MPKPLHTYLAPGPEIENDSVFFDRENGCFYETVEGFTQVVYDPALVVRMTFDRLRDGELLASAKSGPFGKRADLSSDFWRSIIRRDVDWEFDAVPKYGLVAIEVRDTSAEELSATTRLPGPKPDKCDGVVGDSATKRRRGPTPKVGSRVYEQMSLDVKESGREYLEEMLKKNMEDRYKASRDTCRKERRRLLEQLPIGGYINRV